LTSKRPRRQVENDEYDAFVRRVLRAYSRRVGDGDVEALALMLGLAEEIDTAIAGAVMCLGARGCSLAEIGSRLGITRQAAQQRWGAGDRRRLGRVFTETAYCPAHTLGTAVHDARCDQAVQRRQVRRPEPGHHGSEVLRHVIRGRSPPSAICDPVGQAMRAGRPGRAFRAELDPPDDAGQLITQHVERRAVGYHERVDGLRVGLLAVRSARPIEEDPHRGLSRLNLRIVTVLQYLNPRDRAFGEG
jgi:hypothetical protein